MYLHFICSIHILILWNIVLFYSILRWIPYNTIWWIYKIFWPRIDLVICVKQSRSVEKYILGFFPCNYWSYSEWLFRASLYHLCATLIIIPQWNREGDFLQKYLISLVIEGEHLHRLCLMCNSIGYCIIKCMHFIQ